VLGADVPSAFLSYHHASLFSRREVWCIMCGCLFRRKVSKGRVIHRLYESAL
jgi:hypothetical protein